jgi:hypothetical protein
MTLFFFFLMRDFSTFLIMSSEAFPTKTEAISIPYPGLEASKLTSKSDNSFAKRASELGANTPASTISSLKDTTCPMAMDERVTEASKPPLSTWSGGWQGSDGSGEDVVATTNASKDTSSIGSITDDSPCSPCNMGIICRSGATTSEASIEAAGNNDVERLARGEKQP